MKVEITKESKISESHVIFHMEKTLIIDTDQKKL